MDQSTNEHTIELQSQKIKEQDKEIEKLKKEVSRLSNLVSNMQNNIHILNTEKHELKSQLTIVQTEEGRALLQEFPDLYIQTNRWNRQRYVSSKANQMCTDIDVAHNCGCCPDSPLEIWPYVLHNNCKIYAKGIPFTVGESNNYNGDRPYNNWQERFKKTNIPNVIIEKVQGYFNENKPFEDE